MKHRSASLPMGGIAGRSPVKRHSVRPNIIFLWEIDENNCVKLHLSIPKWGNEVIARDFYTVPIQHPVTTYRPASPEEDIISESVQLRKRKTRIDLGDKK